MAQHDYDIENQSGADFRADLNNALSAIASTNSGDTEPTTTFANQLWIDTANNVLKIRNENNNAWITTGISLTADNTFDIDGGDINGITALGIGTDAPSESLVIEGTGDLFAKITTTNDTDKVGLILGDVSAPNAAQIVYEPNFDILRFSAGGVERYRVDSNGSLYIARTDGDVSNTEHGVALTGVGRIKNSVDVAGGGIVTQAFGTAGEFRVKGDGDLENTNNSYGAISDESLKENIVDASPKLEKLKQVQIKTFNLIDHDLKQIGVIAQDLENVFPSLVKDNDDGYKTVKYSVFVPILIKAMQELEQQVADLSEQVQNLQN